jgi:hypothetical protein
MSTPTPQPLRARPHVGLLFLDVSGFDALGHHELAGRDPVAAAELVPLYPAACAARREVVRPDQAPAHVELLPLHGVGGAVLPAQGDAVARGAKAFLQKLQKAFFHTHQDAVDVALHGGTSLGEAAGRGEAHGLLGPQAALVAHFLGAARTGLAQEAAQLAVKLLVYPVGGGFHGAGRGRINASAAGRAAR